MKKSDLEKIETVVNAIINIQDHGEDCACTMCLSDNKIIRDNPAITDAVAKPFKQKR